MTNFFKPTNRSSGHSVPPTGGGAPAPAGRWLLLALAGALLAGGIREAHAFNLYWDANLTTAGAGGTPNGVWGSTNIWNTDSTGAAGGYLTNVTTAADALTWVAGPSGTSGNNSFTCSLALNAALSANSLTFQSSAGTTTIMPAPGIGTNVITLGSGGITLNQYAYGTTAQGNVTFNSALTNNNDLTLGASQTWQNNSVNTLSYSPGTGDGVLNLGGFNLTIGGSGPVTIDNGFLVGSGSLIMNGSGIFTLMGGNSGSSTGFVGSVVLNSGTLATFTGGQHPDWGSNSVLVLNAGTVYLRQSSGVSDLPGTRITNGTGTVTIVSDDKASGGGAGLTYTFGTLAITNANVTVSGGTNMNSGTAGVTFGATTLYGTPTFAVSNWTSSYTGGGTGPTVLTMGLISSAVAGSGITVGGNGTMTLVSGAHTYTGNTIINSGTLKLAATASITNTPQVSIASGATFDVSSNATGFTFSGTGTPQTLAGSSTSGFAAINAAGKTVKLNAGAQLSFQAAGGAAATVGAIFINNNLTLNTNAITVNVTGPALAAGSYLLLTNAGTLTGPATNYPVITGTPLAAGYTSNVVSTTGSPGQVRLIIDATPVFSNLAGSPAITYGGTSLTLTGTVSSATGPATVYAASGDTVTATINGHSVSGSVTDSTGDFTINYNDASLATDGAGSYAITYAYAGNSAVYLNAATNNAATSLTVNGAVLTVTAGNAGKVYNGAAYSGGNGVTYGGFVNGQSSSVLGGTLTYGGTAQGAVGAGTYTIIPAGLTAANYTFNYVNGTLTVSQASPALVVGSSLNPAGYLAGISFSATLPADATGSVTFSAPGGAFSTNSLTGGGATSLTITNLARGTNVIDAIYGGDGNYLPATNTVGQIVTNHPPTAAVMTVTRTAGLPVEIALTDIATNWSDADGDPVSLAAVNLTSTNGLALFPINLTTNLAGSYVTTNAQSYLGYINSANSADQISYSISDGMGGTNIGYINIVIQGSVTGTNSITGITGTNPKTVTAYGVPGFSYVTERSTNLTTWVDITTNTAGANGLIQAADDFSDLGGIPPGTAFYRLKYQP